MHVGKGANGVNLYLDNDVQFAFRGHPTGTGDYDYVCVHEGSIRPLGPVILTLTVPEDTAGLWEVLSAAVRQSGSREDSAKHAA